MISQVLSEGYSEMMDHEPPGVGRRLYALRQEQGLSLRVLAGRVQMSPNAVSLIERGISSPSVDTPPRLATALKVPIVTFFEDQTEKLQVILKRAGERHRFGNAELLLESLGTGLENQALESFVVTLQPGAGSGGQAMAHAGHELVYCLEGELEYVVVERQYHLTAGDCLLFEAKLEHRWKNPGEEPTRRMRLIVTQPTSNRSQICFVVSRLSKGMLSPEAELGRARHNATAAPDSGVL
jgi:transcriptional regulator with XRE-family HTH domain